MKTPRQFWSAYDSLFPNRQCIPALLSDGTVTAESTQSKCNLLNAYFAHVFSTHHAPEPKTLHLHPTVRELSNITCTESEVYDLIRVLPNKTASGPDILSNMLKGTIDAIVPSITNVFNLSLSSGTVPDDWKRSNVTPVYKSGDPKLASNYRPISLLSLPSKILERIVYNKLLHYLTSDSLLSNYQFGFRPGNSTQEALISATTAWHRYLDNKDVAAVFFDLSKAFDTVPHQKPPSCTI